MSWTIWHNPRCRKSRETLELLKSKGVEPEVRLYLDATPSADEIQTVLRGLSCAPRALMRRKEEVYKTKGLGDEGLSDSALIKAMVETPKLIERPVVIGPTGIALGRPPEAVLSLLEDS